MRRAKKRGPSKQTKKQAPRETKTSLTAKGIYDLRMRLNVSQVKFAALLDQSFVSINRWENDRCKPYGTGAVLLELLCRALESASVTDVVRALEDAKGQTDKTLALAKFNRAA